MPALPLAIRLARCLFFLSAAAWVMIGAVTLARLPGATSPVTPIILAAFMFGAAVIFILLAIGLGRRSRWAYRLAVAWAAANIVLTFTDQVGPADLAYLAMAVLLLVLLLLGHRGYEAR